MTIPGRCTRGLQKRFWSSRQQCFCTDNRTVQNDTAEVSLTFVPLLGRFNPAAMKDVSLMSTVRT